MTLSPIIPTWRYQPTMRFGNAEATPETTAARTMIDAFQQWLKSNPLTLQNTTITATPFETGYAINMNGQKVEFTDNFASPKRIYTLVTLDGHLEYDAGQRAHETPVNFANSHFELTNITDAAVEKSAETLIGDLIQQTHALRLQ